MTETNGVLPATVTVTEAFTKRLPAQRLLDSLAHLEPGVPFPELAESQPFRIIAFRALKREFPARDETSLWMHAYDVEVDIAEADPFLPTGPTPTPLSAGTGDVAPQTSTA